MDLLVGVRPSRTLRPKHAPAPVARRTSHRPALVEIIVAVEVAAIVVAAILLTVGRPGSGTAPCVREVSQVRAAIAAYRLRIRQRQSREHGSLGELELVEVRGPGRRARSRLCLRRDERHLRGGYLRDRLTGHSSSRFAVRVRGEHRPELVDERDREGAVVGRDVGADGRVAGRTTTSRPISRPRPHTGSSTSLRGPERRPAAVSRPPGIVSRPVAEPRQRRRERRALEARTARAPRSVHHLALDDRDEPAVGAAARAELGDAADLVDLAAPVPWRSAGSGVSRTTSSPTTRPTTSSTIVVSMSSRRLIVNE